MKLLYNPATYLLSLALALLVACAQIGLPTPQTLNEKIAAAQASVTQVRQSATQLLVAQKISVTDAENTLKATDAASEGIAIVRTMSTTDTAGANAKLTAIVAALTAVQAYLATK